MDGTGFLALMGFAGAAFAAASPGALFKPGAWYEAIRKPSWRPANAVFPIVWAVLFSLMVAASWLVWRASEEWPWALTLYLVHLTINAGWSPIFFGAHKLGLAFAWLILLWLSILATIIAFAPISPLAAWLLAPYLVWVTIAGALNFSIWRLNAAPAGLPVPDRPRA